jgi:two-component system, cell cycle response regulator
MKVLITEDDNMQRSMLQILITRAGHEVVQAMDGEEAWNIIVKENIGLIITDWMMPKMNGLQLIKKIRAANFPTYTYILLLTSKDLKENIVEGLEAGADDYLTKPFDKSELVARMGIGVRILTLQTQLAYMAKHDTLTELLNRRALYDLAQEKMKQISYLGKGVGCILADIDHFKLINDTHGHLAGDQALHYFSQIMRNLLPDKGMLGRWGGEEFLIFLTDVKKDEVREVAEQIRTGIANASIPLSNGRILKMTCSLGISYVLEGEPLPALETLVDRADQALYQAKSSGRNCVFSL